MTADETDVHDAVLILDGCDQPVPIPLDIENHTVVSNKAGIAISVLDIRRVLPFRVSGIIIPSLQRLLRIWMPIPIIFQGLSGNDSHGGNYKLIPLREQGLFSPLVKPFPA